MARRYPCLVNVRLSLRTSSELTRAAAAAGVTRSQWVRLVVGNELARWELDRLEAEHRETIVGG